MVRLYAVVPHESFLRVFAVEYFVFKPFKFFLFDLPSRQGSQGPLDSQGEEAKAEGECKDCSLSTDAYVVSVAVLLYSLIDSDTSCRRV